MEEPLWRAPIARRTLLVAGGTGLLLASLRQSAPIRAVLAADATPSLQLDLLRREDMLKLHYDFYNLVLTGGVGWGTMPIAFSRPNTLSLLTPDRE